jgi:hypothetical protein
MPQRLARRTRKSSPRATAYKTTMATASCLLLLSAAYPLWLAWQGNRGTSLLHAVGWAILAWAGWGGVMVVGALSGPVPGLAPARFVALALTGCAGVAVLGARRPGVGAWNFVVLGLAAVMLLPLAEQALAAAQPLDPVRVVFLAGILAVGVLNYLPTRLAPAALLLAVGCGWEVVALLAPQVLPSALADVHSPAWLCLALAPWAGYACWKLQGKNDSEFDRLWLSFRNRFGLLWGQRLREQFNRAAANAGWPVHLYWQGLRLTTGVPPPTEAVKGEIVAAFRAMLKRFYWSEQ